MFPAVIICTIKSIPYIYAEKFFLNKKATFTKKIRKRMKKKSSICKREIRNFFGENENVIWQLYLYWLEFNPEKNVHQSQRTKKNIRSYNQTDKIYNITIDNII